MNTMVPPIFPCLGVEMPPLLILKDIISFLECWNYWQSLQGWPTRVLILCRVLYMVICMLYSWWLYTFPHLICHTKKKKSIVFFVLIMGSLGWFGSHNYIIITNTASLMPSHRQYGRIPLKCIAILMVIGVKKFRHAAPGCGLWVEIRVFMINGDSDTNDNC